MHVNSISRPIIIGHGNVARRIIRTFLLFDELMNKCSIYFEIHKKNHLFRLIDLYFSNLESFSYGYFVLCFFSKYLSFN